MTEMQVTFNIVENSCDYFFASERDCNQNKYEDAVT